MSEFEGTTEEAFRVIADKLTRLEQDQYITRFMIVALVNRIAKTEGMAGRDVAEGITKSVLNAFDALTQSKGNDEQARAFREAIMGYLGTGPSAKIFEFPSK
jgi:hypothetical protein